MEKRALNKKVISKYLFVGTVLLYPMALFLLMYVYVNFNSFRMAFESSTIQGKRDFVGFDKFKEFFELLGKNGGVLNYAFKNSVKMYVINFVVGVPGSIFFSYLLFKKVPGNKFIRATIMIPQVISSMVVALLFVNIMEEAMPNILFNLKGKRIHLLNNKQYAFGTAMFYMIWVGFGTSCIVYSNAMNEIDGEILESAQLDGISNMFQELWYIVLPLIFPTLTTFIVTGFASILTATGPMMTFYFTSAQDYMYTVGYYYSVQLQTLNETSYNMLAAGGLVMTAIVAPLTYLLKHLLEKYGPRTE